MNNSQYKNKQTVYAERRIYEWPHESIPKARKSFQHNDFTLIELLAVITIIIVLAGILLPSINKAREVANTTICQNNMKQVGVGGLLSYAYDYNEWALGTGYHYFGLDAKTTWVSKLSKSGLGYLNWDYKIKTYAKGVFKCPSEKKPISIPVPAVNFGINNRLAINGVKWKNDYHNGLFKIDAPKNPSRLFYVADSIIDSYSIDTLLASGEPSRRHSGACTNTFFLDAHTKALKTTEMIWPSNDNIYPWSGE